MDENDGQKLFSLIESIGFLPAMKRLEGPHALIYYSRSEEKIYFTRDCLGRRSLLKKKKNRKGEFVLTSTSTSTSIPGEPQSREEEWEEITCEGIWEFDLKAFGQGGESEEVTKVHKRYYESEAPSPDSFVSCTKLSPRDTIVVGFEIELTSCSSNLFPLSSLFRFSLSTD